MASLKEMRNQIASVKATQKITKAMQMVAAAKLRRAQEGAEAARPYATRMAAVIANLAGGVSGDGAPRLLVGTGKQEKHVLVVATSDRGLAGGFNSSIARAAPDPTHRLNVDSSSWCFRICSVRSGSGSVSPSARTSSRQRSRLLTGSTPV